MFVKASPPSNPAPTPIAPVPAATAGETALATAGIARVAAPARPPAIMGAKITPCLPAIPATKSAASLMFVTSCTRSMRGALSCVAASRSSASCRRRCASSSAPNAPATAPVNPWRRPWTASTPDSTPRPNSATTLVSRRLGARCGVGRGAGVAAGTTGITLGGRAGASRTSWGVLGTTLRFFLSAFVCCGIRILISAMGDSGPGGSGHHE